MQMVCSPVADNVPLTAHHFGASDECGRRLLVDWACTAERLRIIRVEECIPSNDFFFSVLFAGPFAQLFLLFFVLVMFLLG
jgi:hypothetical protein